MIKVLVLQRESHVAYGVPSLSVSARIIEPLDYLKEQELVEYIVVYETQEMAQTILNWCDVIILSKHSSDNALGLVLLAKVIGKKVIYDIDDWIFTFPSYSAGKKQLKKIHNIEKIIQCVDFVTVSNAFLFSEVEKMRDDVVLVPNGMFLEKYITNNEASRDIECQSPRIVFTNADLLKVDSSKEIFLNMLQEFFYYHPEYILDFYGDPFPEMFSMSFMHFTNRMTYEDYMVSLLNGRYQFAITPLGGLEDYEHLFFNSCKNPFKYLNYGVAGIPGIYSKSPIYNECVEQDVTGILVNNTRSEWLDALDRMSNDCELRDNIRRKAQIDIMQNFHIKDAAEKMYELF